MDIRSDEAVWRAVLTDDPSRRFRSPTAVVRVLSSRRTIRRPLRCLRRPIVRSSPLTMVALLCAELRVILSLSSTCRTVRRRTMRQGRASSQSIEVIHRTQSHSDTGSPADTSQTLTASTLRYRRLSLASLKACSRRRSQCELTSGRQVGNVHDNLDLASQSQPSDIQFITYHHIHTALKSSDTNHPLDHVAGDVDCDRDCSCRVKVCIADDFHCVKLGGREHQQHLRRGSRHYRPIRPIETRTSSTTRCVGDRIM